MKTLLIVTICILTSPFLKANNMIDTLQTLIHSKDSLNIIKFVEENPQVLEMEDKNGSTGFMLIAYSGLESVFQKAIEVKKSYSFHEAIVAGKESIFRKYIDEDNSLINSYSKDGFTAISLAAFFNQTAIAILLLEKGADPNLQATNPSKVNALHAAVAKENLELCKKLIDFGVNVNSVQTQNVTALHSAAHRGNLKLVQLLVENGAEIEKKMDNGDTPVSIAERDQHQNVLEYLLNNR